MNFSLFDLFDLCELPKTSTVLTWEKQVPYAPTISVLKSDEITKLNIHKMTLKQ